MFGFCMLHLLYKIQTFRSKRERVSISLLKLSMRPVKTVCFETANVRFETANVLTLPQSLNILRYPSLKFWESGVILGTVKSGLEKLQIRSKTCKCVRNLVNTRLMFANTLEKLKMVDMEDDLIHLMVLRRKTPGKYHSTAY